MAGWKVMNFISLFRGVAAWGTNIFSYWIRASPARAGRIDRTQIDIGNFAAPGRRDLCSGRAGVESNGDLRISPSPVVLLMARPC